MSSMWEAANSGGGGNLTLVPAGPAVTATAAFQSSSLDATPTRLDGDRRIEARLSELASSLVLGDANEQPLCLTCKGGLSHKHRDNNGLLRQAESEAPHGPRTFKQQAMHTRCVPLILLSVSTLQTAQPFATRKMTLPIDHPETV